MRSWLESIERALRFVGGVPEMIVEPPRVLRRLLSSREWSLEQDQEEWVSRLIGSDFGITLGIAPTEPTDTAEGALPGGPCPLNLIPQWMVGPPVAEPGTTGL